MRKVLALGVLIAAGLLPAYAWAAGAGIVLPDDELATVWAGSLNGDNGSIPFAINVTQDVSGQNAASGQNVTTAMLSVVAAQNNVATASSNTGRQGVSITQTNNAALLSPIPLPPVELLR
jgi:hypothetical protein